MPNGNNGASTTNPSTLAALVSASVARWPPPNLVPDAPAALDDGMPGDGRPGDPGRAGFAITAENLIGVIAATAHRPVAEVARELAEVLREVNAIVAIALKGANRPPPKTPPRTLPQQAADGAAAAAKPAAKKAARPRVEKATPTKPKSRKTT